MNRPVPLTWVIHSMIVQGKTGIFKFWLLSEDFYMVTKERSRDGIGYSDFPFEGACCSYC